MSFPDRMESGARFLISYANYANYAKFAQIRPPRSSAPRNSDRPGRGRVDAPRNQSNAKVEGYGSIPPGSGGWSVRGRIAPALSGGPVGVSASAGLVAPGRLKPGLQQEQSRHANSESKLAG